MNVLEIKQHIQNKEFLPYYIFAGDEIEVQRIYINKIAEVHNAQVVRADSIADVWQDIISPSLFDNSYVYVIRDDKEMLSENFQNAVASGAIGDNIIIHLITSVDKRTKWYKSNSDRIVVFERLANDVLSNYIRKLITLNNANCERLIAMCENDYSRILLEIDKIQRYSAINNYEYTDDEVFEHLVICGAIHQPPKDAIFDLVDAILKREVNNVYDLLNQCREIGEASLVILSVLYSNAKQVLQVQACESADVCKSTGLTQWQVKCAERRCGYYRNGELVNILRLIQKIQKGIITGQIEDSMSVDFLLVNIL